MRNRSAATHHSMPDQGAERIRTAVSVLRSFFCRNRSLREENERLREAVIWMSGSVVTGGTDTPQGAVALIRAERERQVSVEGWTAEHDDEHYGGDLAHAAAHYALTPSHRYLVDWPWPEAPKCHDDAYGPERIRDLVKAGALIAAEIDRLIRRGVSS